MWRKVIPALAERYTVIAPDLRGFGESSKPQSGYDKRTVAEDIYQLVRHLGFEKVFLVGHDMGGPTAYAYACAHPEDVRRLVILDVAITIDEATAASYYTRLFHLSFHAEPDIAVALVSGRERTYLTHFYRNCYNPGAFSHEDIDEYVAAFSAPGAMRASMAHYGALWTDLEHNKENAKTPLEMPVLALGGEISFGDGALESARKIAKDVRGGTIPGCAHWIAEEQPEALVRELLAFFGEE
jgi:pimeloyl-ACP methyl ester carboxylesterase